MQCVRFRGGNTFSCASSRTNSDAVPYTILRVILRVQVEVVSNQVAFENMTATEYKTIPLSNQSHVDNMLQSVPACLAFNCLAHRGKDVKGVERRYSLFCDDAQHACLSKCRTNKVRDRSVEQPQAPANVAGQAAASAAGLERRPQENTSGKQR